MSVPWLKFYPSAWRSDPALRMCSVGARGLWIEMLCIMHEAEPRGSLLINGLAVSGRQLAMLVGMPLKDVAALLGELAGAGVFSREGDGTIYSRRMRRDTAKSDEGREHVAKRLPSRSPSSPPSRSDHRSPPNEPSTKILEARTENLEPERKISSLRSDSCDWPADFRELFWGAYPKKIGKSGALKKLEVVLKSRIISYDRLMAAVREYAAIGIDPKFIKNPEVWLNKGCWDDDFEALKRSQGPPRNRDNSFLELALRLGQETNEQSDQLTIDHEPFVRSRG